MTRHRRPTLKRLTHRLACRYYKRLRERLARREARQED